MFYLKEMEAAIGDTYKVEVVSQRDPAVKASLQPKLRLMMLNQSHLLKPM